MAIGNVTGRTCSCNHRSMCNLCGNDRTAMACCVTIGAIMLPYMLEAGYSREFSTAVFSAGAVLGPIIPPSTAMIIYAVNTNVSLTDLYLMGVPAGIYMAIGLGIVAWLSAGKTAGKVWGVEKTVPRKNFISVRF